ncbi:hypothetical protein CY34DRAFT_641299 [Suillus luteus UH-Slu-Lm8-n1]|uniref:Uncharacterized protein n=1 Tax=Suillus luteus UH-Slu-Lm8-n1 TaxID=930992 RepID=A0A0D0B2Q4_9AGAM|nr:hypothetical protein CY34DRAFT_641299 [Suillus luteus UH-Slu-Lm8-n1]
MLAETRTLGSFRSSTILGSIDRPYRKGSPVESSAISMDDQSEIAAYFIATWAPVASVRYSWGIQLLPLTRPIGMILSSIRVSFRALL